MCDKLLAISLCNGGGGGQCLAPCMYNFLVYDESKCQPAIDDVQDSVVKDTLLQVKVKARFISKLDSFDATYTCYMYILSAVSNFVTSNSYLFDEFHD